MLILWQWYSSREHEHGRIAYAYVVDHVKSNLYYPQSNDQAEARTRLCFGYHVESSTRSLRDKLTLCSLGLSNLKEYIDASYAFHFSLWAKLMVSIDVMVHFVTLALVSKLGDPYYRIDDVEALKERTKNADDKCMSYQKQTNKTYNTLKPQLLYFGYLILKTT